MAALHIVVHLGHTEACRILLEKYAENGGDVLSLLKVKARGENYAGKTPLGIAKDQSKKEMKIFLNSILRFAKFVGPDSFNTFLANFGKCTGGK